MAGENEVDLPATQQFVERADVGRLQIDPRKDRRITQLAVEVIERETPTTPQDGIEADTMEVYACRAWFNGACGYWNSCRSIGNITALFREIEPRCR